MRDQVCPRIDDVPSRLISESGPVRTVSTGVRGGRREENFRMRRTRSRAWNSRSAWERGQLTLPARQPYSGWFPNPFAFQRAAAMRRELVVEADVLLLLPPCSCSAAATIRPISRQRGRTGSQLAEQTQRRGATISRSSFSRTAARPSGTPATGASGRRARSWESASNWSAMTPPKGGRSAGSNNWRRRAT